MHHYRYKAINDSGKYVTGKLSAENPAELSTLLRATQLELISFKEEKSAGSGLFGASITPKELITIFVHLEQLEKTGVSIADSIHDLIESADSQQVKNIMSEVEESIKNGSFFSESLGKRPDVFNPIHVGLIAMGEKTGNLSSAFNSIIEDIKWSMDIKRKTKKATTGPMFGLGLMFLIMGIMTSVVVPKVTGFLAAQDIKLPVTTTSLIAFSDFVKGYWHVLLITPPILWISFRILAHSSEEMAVMLDNFKLKVPIIGAIMIKIDAAKFCQLFSMTFKSGLGVLECLDASSGAIKNRAIKKSIITVKQQISDGQSLSKSIGATGYFPSLVVRMFKVGEESGNMESALQNIKFFYDREINDSIDKLVSMIQPTITMVMGGMIAWITIAVFGPIYSTFSKMK
ncbi:MAG: type II secretion system F family protein [Alphaproteobacteria bacterium]|nr:type II secretion system F family protein [Alphaproteobacteria bacterium]